LRTGPPHVELRIGVHAGNQQQIAGGADVSAATRCDPVFARESALRSALGNRIL
jgi:hypothetical protein